MQPTLLQPTRTARDYKPQPELALNIEAGAHRPDVPKYLKRAYHNMKSRVRYNRDYVGVNIHPRWLADPGSFYDYVLRVLGPRPRPGKHGKYSIDRIVDSVVTERGHYVPGNIRWADKRRQALNRRTSRQAKREALRAGVNAYLANRFGQEFTVERIEAGIRRTDPNIRTISDKIAAALHALIQAEKDLRSRSNCRRETIFNEVAKCNPEVTLAELSSLRKQRVTSAGGEDFPSSDCLTL